MVNNAKKPNVYKNGTVNLKDPPNNVASQLKILTPVGIAIINVAAVKYDLVSTSNPTTYIWWLQTQNPKNPIEPIAYTIPIEPKIGLLAYLLIISDTIPNPGIIKIYTSGWPKNPLP